MRQGIVKIALFTIDERRQPLIVAGVHAPAVEMEVVAGPGRTRIGAVKPHNVETLVLDPNAAEEAPFAGARRRGDVENHAADLAQEFTPDVIELVVLFIEAVAIDIDHL